MFFYILAILFSVVVFSFGVVVFYHNPKGIVNRLFFFMTFWGMLVSGLIGFSFLFPNNVSVSTLLDKGAFACKINLLFSALVYSIVFPRGKAQKNIYWWIGILLGIGFILSIFVFFTNNIIIKMVIKESNGNRILIRETGPLYIWYNILFLILLLSIIATFLIKLRKTKFYLEKKQIQYALIGIGVAFLTGAILGQFLPFIGITKFYVFAPPLAFSIFLIFNSYAILSSGVVEIRLLLNKFFMQFADISIGIVIITLIFMLIDFSVFKELNWFYKGGLGLILFALLYYSRDALHNKLESIIVGEHIKQEIRIKEKLANVISDVVEVEDFAKKLLSLIIESFGLKFGIFFIWNEDSKQYELRSILGEKEETSYLEELFLYEYVEETALYSEGITLPSKAYSKESEFVQSIININQPVITREQITIDEKLFTKGMPISEIFDLTRGEVMLSFIFNKNLLGFMILGSKIANRPYFSDEIEILKYIVEKMSIFMFNVINKEHLTRITMLEQEMKMGAEIQRQFLPERAPDIKGIDIYGDMKASKMISGDYFDFIKLGRNNLFIFIGDVAGKGIVAGFIMVMIRTALRNLIRTSRSLKEIALKLNEFVRENTKSDIFLTGVFLYWSGDKKVLKFLGCGHEALLLYRARYKICERILTGGKALGVIKNIDPFLKASSIELEKGDIVVVFTDGITEAESVEGEQFGFTRIMKIIEDSHDLSARGIYEKILLELEKHIKGVEQKDDYTIVIMKVLE
jgi:serine phosphatase RsbU (regulator of sigma subunit)